MENNTVPNTAAELLAMQVQPEIDTEGPDAFADYITEVVAVNFEPTMFQAVKAAEKLLKGVENYHFNMVTEGADEMHPEMLKMWKRDLKRLRKAGELLKLIEEC